MTTMNTEHAYFRTHVDEILYLDFTHPWSTLSQAPLPTPILEILSLTGNIDKDKEDYFFDNEEVDEIDLEDDTIEYMKNDM